MGRLTTQNLHFSREGRTILRDLAFEHEPGRVLTILGPSGSGKTTLLWLLAGLLKPDHGSVGFSDGDADHLGFVFQDGGLWDHLGVRGHLHCTTTSGRENRVRGLVKARPKPSIAAAEAEAEGGVRAANEKGGYKAGIGLAKRLAKGTTVL